MREKFKKKVFEKNKCFFFLKKFFGEKGKKKNLNFFLLN